MGRSDAVVVLVPDTTFGGHLQDVIQGATAELGDAGFTLLTYFEGSGVDGLERLISVVRPAAVLPLGNVDPELAQVIDRTPGVVLAHVPGAVGKDGELIGAMQAEHLIERGYQQLRFAAFLDRRSDLYGDGRKTGFEQACRAHGIEPLPAWSLTVSGEMAAECAFQVGDESEGIGCYNDEIAVTLLGAMLRRGLDVPGRVGVIGVDHTALGQAIPTPLTTIAYDPWQRGKDLGRFALEMIGKPASARSIDRPYSVVQGSTT
jgi:DNA-binding LacI/PurR family transcriptional regulator